MFSAVGNASPKSTLRYSLYTTKATIIAEIKAVTFKNRFLIHKILTKRAGIDQNLNKVASKIISQPAKTLFCGPWKSLIAHNSIKIMRPSRFPLWKSKIVGGENIAANKRIRPKISAFMYRRCPYETKKYMSGIKIAAAIKYLLCVDKCRISPR